MTLSRHGRTCHSKSGIPDLLLVKMRKSGKPDFRCHPRLSFRPRYKDVDARHKAGHDAAFGASAVR